MLVINKVILMREDNQLSLYWSIDEITSVQRGDDGIIRDATMHPVGGLSKHAVCQLCLLEVLQVEGNHPNLPTH